MRALDLLFGRGMLVGALVLLVGCVVEVKRSNMKRSSSDGENTGQAQSPAKGSSTTLGAQPGDVRYDIIGLGLMHSVSDISNDGDVVGQSFNQDGVSQGAYWKQGKLTYLGAGGFRISTARSVGVKGTVVGRVIGDSGRTLVSKAVMWRDGRLDMLPGLPTASDSMANSVNELGQIVGSVDRARGLTGRRACLWQGGKVFMLASLPGSIETGANSINNVGQVVGVSSDNTSGEVACSWDGGRVVSIHPAKATKSVAMDINDSGAVVGWFAAGTFGHRVRRAFLYQGGRHVTLEAPPAHDRTEAYSINDSMQVVGLSGHIGSADSTAVLWTGGQVVDLNSRVDPNAGWTLDIAAAINDRGEIVGIGHYHGDLRAFVIRPRR